MSLHAVLSPSKADRWIDCPGSVALCADIEDSSSSYADEGTAAHAVAAARLKGIPGPAAADVETSDYIAVYCNAIRNAAEGKILLVEVGLNLEKWTTEEGGKGTADAIIIDLEAAAIEVDDLKFGAGHIVDAPDNKQLMLYGLGALDLVEMCYGPVKTIKLVIHQPRRDHISEVVMSREELVKFGALAQRQGAVALQLLADKEKLITVGGLSTFGFLEALSAKPKACLWCPAKATCPELLKTIQGAVFEEFATCEAGQTTAKSLKVKPIAVGSIPSADMLDLIRQYANAAEAFIDERLKAGDALAGWKLVLGKKGNRKFKDLALVEKLLKKLKFKKPQIYETSLIPLTKIEKLVPKDRWKLFEVLIEQTPGQTQAAPESDSRPAYKPVEIGAFDAFK